MSTTTVTIDLVSGPYQNNGSTTWYAELPFGTPGQALKVAFDTGSNFLWVSSTLCQESGCDCSHYGDGFFDYGASSTFAWVDRTPQTVGFGPWGEMTVETGQDTIAFAGNGSTTTFYLSKCYSGVQYQQLDWDGGLGVPSGTAYVKDGMSNPIADLFNAGVLTPDLPYLSFDCDETTNTGTLLLAGFDPSRYNPTEYVYMPWESYTPYPKVNYMWNTLVDSIAVGGTVIATDKFFCLDTGSSRFKGDPKIIDPLLAALKLGGYSDDVVLTFPGGTITVPPGVYMKTIEAGPDKGQTLPQFEAMDGLDDQVLVGSVLVDQLYTIFEFAMSGSAPDYTMTPKGMWMFNKVDGQGLITTQHAEPADLGERTIKDKD